MKLSSKHDDATAQAIASRWKLELQDCVAETQRARIFRAKGPKGPSALKLYKRIGSSGESASVPFLRDLASGAGAQIYRFSPLRTAVLMEWLEGPSLQELVTDGQEARATKLLAQVARAVTQSSFRFPYIYGRLWPVLHSSLQGSNDPQLRDLIQRSLALLDHLGRTTKTTRVIHGDLGYGNIILTANGPKLIDPKGLRADPACEYARALVVPYGVDSVQEFKNTVNRRTHILAEGAGAPAQRIIQWAAVNLARTAVNRSRRQASDVDVSAYLTAILDLSERKSG